MHSFGGAELKFTQGPMLVPGSRLVLAYEIFALPLRTPGVAARWGGLGSKHRRERGWLRWWNWKGTGEPRQPGETPKPASPEIVNIPQVPEGSVLHEIGLMKSETLERRGV